MRKHLRGGGELVVEILAVGIGQGLAQKLIDADILAPWLHRFDARIAEDFCFKAGKTTHNFQLSVSIDNIGNLFNSNWGVTRLSTYQTSYSGASGILKYEGVNENNRPVFSMNKVDGAYPTESYANFVKTSTQTWQILFGLKYFFN